MHITRHQFLKYCLSGAGALGLDLFDLSNLQKALGASGRRPQPETTTAAATARPAVLWLEGSGCSGCSISFLNRVSPSSPKTVADVLISTVDLKFHPTLMAAAGDLAVNAVQAAYQAGGYVLVVEGAVPRGFGGAACTVWTYNGVETTMRDAVVSLAARAAKTVCVGSCSAYGGVSAAPPNPTGATGVKAVIGRTTINVPGCPPHPDWVVAVLAKLIANTSMPLDSAGRPKFLFNSKVHDRCPYKEKDKAKYFSQPNRCLEDLGCQGPETVAPCPSTWFNGGANWCIGAGGNCIGCTEPVFPRSQPLFKYDD